MMEKLNLLMSRLLPFAETIELKGSGKSAFLYMTGNGKSVEVSLDGNSFWVEYWDCLDEDAEPVGENSIAAVEIVEKSVIEWLE